MLNKYYSYRAINIYAIMFTVAILAFAAYAQLDKGLIPCPLCVMQRLVFAVSGLLFLAASLHVAKPRARQVFHAFISLVILLGTGIAARHIYLQHLPPELAPGCGPGLNFIIKNLPPGETLKMLLTGSGDCGEIRWHFMGLTLPEWSLICFLILFILNGMLFFKKIRASR